MTADKVTSLRIPMNLFEKLHRKAHLLALERGNYVSINRLVCELLEMVLRNKGKVMELKS
jgi:hypothetical protein